MRFETTLNHPVSYQRRRSCISGVPVNMRILPAPPSTGIVFERTDLDNFRIPASCKHVARVSYATSLMRQGVLISTTEHLLSVLYSMGIDNAIIQIDNLEVPIVDGSGLPFIRAIQDAGIRTYRRRRRYLRIKTAGIGGGSRKAHHDSTCRQVPPYLRYLLRPSPGRPANPRNGSHARALCHRHRSCENLRIRVGTRPDAQHGPDSRRHARLGGLLQSRSGYEPRRICGLPTNAAATKSSI